LKSIFVSPALSPAWAGLADHTEFSFVVPEIGDECDSEEIVSRALSDWMNQNYLRQCQSTGENVRRTLREILADSHISAVAIAVLLVWSIDSGFKTIMSLLVLAFEFSVSMVMIGSTWWHDGIISFGSPDMLFDRSLFVMTMEYFFWTVISFGAAWIVSRCVYSVGPLRTLSTYRARVARRDYV
jgi:hypothetical protein